MQTRTSWTAAFAGLLAVATAACGADMPAQPTNPDGSPPLPIVILATVTDSADRPLGGVRVTVAGSSDTAAVSDSTGRVALRPRILSRAVVAVEATSSGYRSFLGSLDLRTPQDEYEIAVSLTPEVLPNLAGDYRLTLVADAQCGLSAAARRRTYRATIPATSGPRSTMTLAGAPFFNGASLVGIRLARDFARFAFSASGDFVDVTPLVELQVDGGHLQVWGTATSELVSNAAVINGQLSGIVSSCVNDPPSAVPALFCGYDFGVNCESQSHQVLLERLPSPGENE